MKVKIFTEYDEPMTESGYCIYTLEKRINDFVIELLAVADKYDLSDYEINNYFNLAEEEL